MFDREPFLKAIFADPADDLPRLVFADYLDEQGESDWAELIRVQCELARRKLGRAEVGEQSDELAAREVELLRSERLPWAKRYLRSVPERGFPTGVRIEAPAGLLADGDAFRQTALSTHPEWYGATEFKLTDGCVSTAAELAVLLTSPVTERVTELVLEGVYQRLPNPPPPRIGASVICVLQRIRTELRPVVTRGAVEMLAQMREARRLTLLDLRDNSLDDQAARAIERSPHLIRLTKLEFSRGNRFSGRTWQRLLERFGPDVLG